MMLTMIFVTITMSAASAKRIMEVVNEKADITSPDNPITHVDDGSIEFENVSFYYSQPIPDDDGVITNTITRPALQNVNLHVAAGQTLGVIGGTGCGKSTLASMLARLYDVRQGSVKVGGVDVRRYDVEVLRNNVAMILQNNQLFSGTVIDNLRWGNPDATEEECIEACKMAQADDFIRQMPDGYNSLIEQNGVNVSGGQRQRLCIARALLKHPKILIVDDSTSACDTATEAKILDAFNSINDITKVIISQRIQSVAKADIIVVMDSGAVNAIGKHQQLLETNKIYQDIFSLQSDSAADFDQP